MKPFWKIKHEWWIEDFEFEQEQKREFVMLARKNIDTDMGVIFRDLIGMIDDRIKSMKKEYKKIYGTNFNLRRIPCQNQKP